jgi:hypothetical protein
VFAQVVDELVAAWLRQVGGGAPDLVEVGVDEPVERGGWGGH